MTAVVRGRAALAAGQVTDGLVRDLCDEIDGLMVTWRTAATSRDRWMVRAKDSEKAYRDATAERDAALAAIERVRAEHQGCPEYEHEDVCLSSSEWADMDEDQRDEHRENHHHMDSSEYYSGEYYCDQQPTGIKWCASCRDIHGDPMPWPCATIQTLGDQT